MRYVAIGAFLLTVVLGACADDTRPKSDSDAIPPAQETAVGSPKNDDSDDTDMTHLPGGITVTHTKNGTIEMDESGHGAVLCAWEIYLELRYFVDACFPNDAETRSVLSEGIAKIDKFIIENAPATPQQVEERKGRILSNAKSEVGGAKCEGETAKMLGSWYEVLRADPAKLREGVDELLSVPRKPVMNPCL